VANVEDRWTKPDPDGGRKRVRTDRYGTGLRWRATWNEPDGSRRRRSFATKDAAQAHLEHVGVAKRTGAYVSADRGRITVAEFATSWLDAQTHLKPSGRERVEGIVQLHLLPRWGAVALADITHEDVQAWVNYLDGSPATIQRVHGVLARMLDGAVKARRVVTNEARGVNRPKRVNREHRYLTVGELDRLLAECGAWAPVVRCLALTGMRVGEAAELRVRDVDVARKRAVVSRSMTTLAGRRVVGSTKTDAGVRSVPLVEEVLDDVRELVKGRRRDDLVYLTPKGAQLRKDNLRRAFRAAVVAAGIDGGLRPHDLRHTAASLAVASGASVKTVQRMMGHASAAITLDVYAGLFDQDLDDVMDRIGVLLLRERSRSQPPNGSQDEAA
jgi:integrase